MIWKYFFSEKSASEHGTLYQLRNLLSQSNVTKHPKKNFDACDDFFIQVCNSLLLVASMDFLQMESLNDTPSASVLPNAEGMWAESKERRTDILEKLCGNIIDRVVSFNLHEEEAKEQDKIYDYITKLVSLGLFYMEFCDSIREGDGERVLRCWKFLLPIFKNSGRKNYSLEALYFLYQYEFLLPPQQAERLLWSRFVNTHGIIGHNIPGDLCLEHLNRLCKGAVNDKGSNKGEKAFTFVGKILGVLQPVLDQYDTQNHVNSSSGHHKRPNADKNRDILINHLRTLSVFSQQGQRKYPSFPKPKSLLCIKKAELLDWMEQHIK